MRPTTENTLDVPTNSLLTSGRTVTPGGLKPRPGFAATAVYMLFAWNPCCCQVPSAAVVTGAGTGRSVRRRRAGT